MNFQKFTLAVAALFIGATVNVAQAQQSLVMTDDDDFIFRGCVRRANVQTSAPQTSSSGAKATSCWTQRPRWVPVRPIRSVQAACLGRVFYWLDADDDLANHIGWLVEVEGDLRGLRNG